MIRPSFLPIVTVGNRFFNLNYQTGAYGTKNRQFQMTLENDYAISGVASVDVPTTIMTLFGYNNMAINVKCEAKLNFSNTDVMFVLDTTGSMADTNPGDSSPKISILKNVVSNFHAQLEGSKSPGTVILSGQICDASAFVLFYKSGAGKAPGQNSAELARQNYPDPQGGGRKDEESAAFCGQGNSQLGTYRAFEKNCFAKPFSMPLKYSTDFCGKTLRDTPSRLFNERDFQPIQPPCREV